MTEIAITALTFAAFWFLGRLALAGLLFLRMAGGLMSCLDIYAAWCEQRDAETDAAMRRGFRAAEKRGLLTRDFK